MEGKQMIDVLVSAMYSYCKSKCLEPDNDAILNRVINQYKCRTEEFIEKFSHNEYKSFSILLKGGLIINKVFPEFGNHIYFEDLTGKSGNHFWNVFKNDNSSVLKYEPFIIGKSYLQSITENGIVTIEYDRVYIHPMYLFAALLKFSAFEHNTVEIAKEDESLSKYNLSLHEVALLHCYIKPRITKLNSDEILKDHEGLNSGEALYNKYLKVQNVVDRIGVDDTKPKMTKNKLKRMEKLKEYIIDKYPKELDAIIKINDEINTLKKNMLD